MTSDSITAQVGKLEQGVEGNKQSISRLTMTSEGIQAEVGKLDKGIKGNSEKIAKLQMTSDGVLVSVQKVEGDIIKLGKDLSTQEQSVATLEIKSDKIQAGVSSLSRDVGHLRSDLTILDGQISSKVSYTDYNGNNIVSRINQTAGIIQIDANRIDLRGITSIYSSDGRSYVSMGNEYGDLSVYHKGHNYFSTFYSIPGVEFRNTNTTFMSAFEKDVTFYGDVDILGKLNSTAVPVFG